jgi:23S rRNA (uracil1939-C5)-methyltransferase
MYVINPKPHDSFSDLNVHLYRGQPYLEEHMEQLKFLVGPKSFFQTHSRQALKLYQVVRQMAGLTGKERVYDLYTGIGTIALFLAAGAREVVGIEYVDEAVQDAARNAEYNRVSNASFYSGDMKDIFTFEFLARHGKPDVLVLDPPRAGVHPKVIEQILVARPDKIVYVSCNPATQARDLHLMQELYDITAVQPVDMFPQTHHVENVVRLDLKK